MGHEKNLEFPISKLNQAAMPTGKPAYDMIANQGYDLVIGVGFLFEDAIKAVSEEFPDTRFAIVDGFVPDKPNVVSLRFREHDGSLQFGIIAAMKAQADGKGTWDSWAARIFR